MVNSSRGPTHRLSPLWPPRTGACRESQAGESTKQTCSDDRTSTQCKESLRENAACDREPRISDKNRNSRVGRPVTRSVRGSSPISRSSIHVRSQCALGRWTSITKSSGSLHFTFRSFAPSIFRRNRDPTSVSLCPPHVNAKALEQVCRGQRCSYHGVMPGCQFNDGPSGFLCPPTANDRWFIKWIGAGDVAGWQSAANRAIKFQFRGECRKRVRCQVARQMLSIGKAAPSLHCGIAVIRHTRVPRLLLYAIHPAKRVLHPGPPQSIR
jgi:hypothetical protein